MAQSVNPKLVVNFVVSGMRPADLERYQQNFEDDGIKLLYDNGLRFTDCQFRYQQTTTPVSLTTLSTGAQPSTHGVVGEHWYDYVVNERVELIEDSKTENIPYSSGEGGYSSHNLVAPTLSDALLLSSPKSRAVTVALDPVSAIVINGKGGKAFWFDERTCSWSSSKAYMRSMPSWVSKYNSLESDIKRAGMSWLLTRVSDAYVNACYTDEYPQLVVAKESRAPRGETRQQRYERYYDLISNTPVGNGSVALFAQRALVGEELGKDEYTDLLNICFDVSRNVVEKFGPESIEAEDMYYKLDVAIAKFMKAVNEQCPANEVVYVLTSDHGTSSSYDDSSVEKNRFNARQFEVILNGFLSARYGTGNWVLSCTNRNIYLNHNLIYEKGLSLSDLQDEAATFALQVEGVSQALTATALRSNYFGSGYAHMIQNSFYPRRSGDVILNLMPNWIEVVDGKRSQSGSMYNYDRDVPLLFYSPSIEPGEVSRSIDAVDVTPTLSQIMGVDEPAASEGKSIEEVINALK